MFLGHLSCIALSFRVLPHSAFRGQTPDEMYFGTVNAVPADLASRTTAARRTRVEASRPNGNDVGPDDATSGRDNVSKPKCLRICNSPRTP
jgi:hypothetical protein